MSEPRYDAETLRKVAAHAARLQSEREARRSSHRERKFSAEDMDQIGREVGLDPALMRQALGHVTALETAKRHAARQARLAIAACCAFLTAGLVFAYKVQLDNQVVVTYDTASPEPAAGSDFAAQNEDTLVPSPGESAAPDVPSAAPLFGTRLEKGPFPMMVARADPARYPMSIAEADPVWFSSSVQVTIPPIVELEPSVPIRPKVPQAK